jgi:hypothetical protein
MCRCKTTIAFEDLKGIIATDLPGRFPTTSGQGNTYVRVMYDFDSNSINAVGVKNRKKEPLSGFRVWRQYWRQFWGYIFSGAYFPQKWDVLPPFQPRFKLFQGHVLSYQVKSTPGWFLWAAPSLLRARTYFIIALIIS